MILKDLENLKETKGYDKYTLLFKVAMFLNAADRVALDQKIDNLRKLGGLKAHAVRETAQKELKIYKALAKPEDQHLDQDSWTKRQRNSMFMSARNKNLATDLLDKKLNEIKKAAGSKDRGRGGYRGRGGRGNRGGRGRGNNRGYYEDRSNPQNRPHNQDRRDAPYRYENKPGRGNFGQNNGYGYANKCKYPLTTPEKLLGKPSIKISEIKIPTKVPTTEDLKIETADINPDFTKANLDKLWKLKEARLKQIAEEAEKQIIPDTN